MEILNILAFTILLITGTTTAVYWPCESNDDCTAEESTCSTVNSLCECESFDTVFSSDYSKCLKTSLFGDQCEESVQCNLMPSGANCKSGVCDCADGETYVRGRCRVLNGLNQNCDTDLDCYFGYDRKSVQCQDNICTCANGYYHRHGNICRRKSMEIDDACVVDTDCDGLGENIKCRSLKCQYVDEIKSKDLTPSKLTSNNIHKLNNNISSNNNHIQHNKNINSRTKRQTSTTTTVTTNSETRSILSKSSSPSLGDLNIVTKLVNGLNNNLSDTDSESDLITEPDEKLIKKKLAPTAPNATKQQQTQKSREIAVQTSIEGFELKVLTPKVRNVGTITTTLSTSSSSRRPSRQRRRPTVFRFDDDEKTFSTVSNTDDDNENRNYGSSCTETGKSCSGLPHSICSNSICLCKQGYYNKNEKCFAELGEIAESTDECENEFDVVSNKCICQKNFFYERSLRECRKPIQYHLSCTLNSQCSPFGAAFCHPDIPRRCTCEEYAEYDELLQMCVYKQGLGSECETNDGCPVEHSVCSNRYCVCKDNFIQKDNECVAGLGAECLENDDCNIEESICAVTSSNTTPEEQTRSCQCRKGFVHFKDQCLKEAVEIEDECVESEQCEPLLATCIDKKCSCTGEEHFQDGRCEAKKGLNEACSRAGECYLEKEPENVECRNSVCQCKFGYQSDVEHRHCHRVASNKKNSSGRPSALKIVTFLLIGSAFLITSAAIRQAYS